MIGDTQPLLVEEATPTWRRRSNILCLVIFGIGLISLLGAILAGYSLFIHKNAIGLKVLALNTWGMPKTFGSVDKEKRMRAIGEHIQKKGHDVYLLSELWMRPDHNKIREMLPPGFHMTQLDQFSKGSGLLLGCDGRIGPDGCSGLAIVSRFPFIEVEFMGYTDHGDALWGDGEYLARKGVGRARIEPSNGTIVDLYVTHTCASDYNYWYRQRQVKELVKFVNKSDADFVVLGGDFNVDPKVNGNETTYHDVRALMKNSMEEFFKIITEWLVPKRSTYGNPENTYSGQIYAPVLYDYIWHKAKGNNTAWTNLFDVPYLKFLLNQEGANVEEAVNKRSFSDHEAVTAHLLLLKA